MRRGAMARLAVAARAFSASASGAGAGGVSMVQGASRGIGLEFVRQLLRRSGEGRVVATCLAPGSAAELEKLKEEHAPGRLTVLLLDVTDKSTLEAAAASITETHGSLDLLINSAGILSIPNTTLSKVQKSTLMLAYEHMWPLLKIGGRSETGRGFALVANMSARVSSIGDNALGGWHAYRASKTALNQLTKTVSVEFGRKDNIACILEPWTLTSHGHFREMSPRVSSSRESSLYRSFSPSLTMSRKATMASSLHGMAKKSLGEW
ncbi:unnamed protein product [Miscanthus lutarioriparius]|uniref:Uncharacterized protein n=1 Tax=Miscanthus lutarioriparius TaxID=422564 RepID=A0A811R9Z0_9POAL|nr:unnamed protein product [Miscanthus lutarioriparius]